MHRKCPSRGCRKLEIVPKHWPGGWPPGRACRFIDCAAGLDSERATGRRGPPPSHRVGRFSPAGSPSPRRPGPARSIHDSARSARPAGPARRGPVDPTRSGRPVRPRLARAPARAPPNLKPGLGLRVGGKRVTRRRGPDGSEFRVAPGFPPTAAAAGLSRVARSAHAPSDPAPGR